MRNALNRPRLNPFTTATGPASRVGQPQPATPVLDGDFAPLYHYPNRTLNRFNRPANRVKGEGPGVARASRGLRQGLPHLSLPPREDRLNVL